MRVLWFAERVTNRTCVATSDRAWRRAGLGDSPRGLMKRATDEFLRAFKQGRRAVRHFKAVGLSSPLRGITQTP